MRFTTYLRVDTTLNSSRVNYIAYLFLNTVVTQSTTTYETKNLEISTFFTVRIFAYGRYPGFWTNNH